jgi:hypothetical protein
MSVAHDMVPPMGKTLRSSMEAFLAFLAPHYEGDLHYRGDLDLVLREGREYQPARFEEFDYPRGAERKCFVNAFHLADAHPELTYVEGFASKRSEPIHHAWCVTEDGRVVDPTWQQHDGDPEPEQWEYLGVPFELAFVDEITDRKGTYAVFDDYTIYASPLPGGAVKDWKEEGA